MLKLRFLLAATTLLAALAVGDAYHYYGDHDSRIFSDALEDPASAEDEGKIVELAILCNGVKDRVFCAVDYRWRYKNFLSSCDMRDYNRWHKTGFKYLYEGYCPHRVAAAVPLYSDDYK